MLKDKPINSLYKHATDLKDLIEKTYGPSTLSAIPQKSHDLCTEIENRYWLLNSIDELTEVVAMAAVLVGLVLLSWAVLIGLIAVSKAAWCYIF